MSKERTENTEREESLLDFKLRAEAANILKVAERLNARLERVGASAAWTGPCPSCGGTGGFSIDVEKRVFACIASRAGGDVVAMVRHARALGSNFAAWESINDEPQARDAEG
jgi:hypothetical protein